MDKPEDFYGPSPALSRAIDKVKAAKSMTMRGWLMLAVVFVVVVLFGSDGPLDPFKAVVPMLLVLMGFYSVVMGPIEARKHAPEVARLTASPPPEVVWYRLDGDGLTILADMKHDLGDAGLSAPWTAMDTLEPVSGAPSELRLTYYPSGATKPATHRLGMDRKRADGVLFGDRLKALFAARPARREARTMSQAPEGLRATWRAQSPAVRLVMTLGVGVLAVTLVWGGISRVGDAVETPPAKALTQTPATNMILDNPPNLAIEQGPGDPAGVLRKIAGGDLPDIQIGYRWFGILEERPIDRDVPPPGRTTQFEWSRKAASWATIDIFETQQHAAAALEQVSGAEARDLLMPNPDGQTQYVPLIIAAPDGSAKYDMRCAVRPKLFYCSAIPAGAAAIVTVKLRIDTVPGDTPAEGQAKVKELTLEMGKEVDEVMRALSGIGLSGTRAVVR